MARKPLTESQIIKWLQKNQTKINISDMAKEIDMDVSNLKKSINRVPRGKGTSVHRIPQRCIEACRTYIAGFSEIPTKAEAQL